MENNNKQKLNENEKNEADLFLKNITNCISQSDTMFKDLGKKTDYQDVFKNTEEKNKNLGLFAKKGANIINNIKINKENEIKGEEYNNRVIAYNNEVKKVNDLLYKEDKEEKINNEFESFNKEINNYIEEKCNKENLSENVKNDILKTYNNTIDLIIKNKQDNIYKNKMNEITGNQFNTTAITSLFSKDYSDVETKKIFMENIEFGMKMSMSCKTKEKFAEVIFYNLKQRFLPQQNQEQNAVNEESNLDQLQKIQNNFNSINSANGISMMELSQQMLQTIEQNKSQVISGLIDPRAIENDNRLEIIKEENNEENKEESSQEQKSESADEEMELLRDKLQYNDKEIEQQRREELKRQNQEEEDLKELENLEAINLAEENKKENNKNEENIQQREQIEINERQNQNNIEEDNLEIEMTEEGLNNIYNTFTFNQGNRNQGTSVRFDGVIKNINSRWGIACLFSRKARLENMLYNSLHNRNDNTISLADLNEIIVQSAGCC